jgi:hypothetical protein
MTHVLKNTYTLRRYLLHIKHILSIGVLGVHNGDPREMIGTQSKRSESIRDLHEITRGWQRRSVYCDTVIINLRILCWGASQHRCMRVLSIIIVPNINKREGARKAYMPEK